MDDIKFLPSDKLIIELLSRYDHAIFSGMKIGINKENDCLTARKWVGNSATCSGLCSQMQYRINKTNDDESAHLEDDDRILGDHA